VSRVNDVSDVDDLINDEFFCRNLSAIQDREICCYSISCKEKDNIDITLQVRSSFNSMFLI
jgi:hypothetical protein